MAQRTPEVMSHRGAEKEVSGRREGPTCQSGMRKMAHSNGFDKPEATRVSSQGSFTAVGKQKPKQIGIRMWPQSALSRRLVKVSLTLR